MIAGRILFASYLLLVSYQESSSQQNLASPDLLWIAPAAKPTAWQPYPLELRLGRILNVSRNTISFEATDSDESAKAPASSTTEIPVHRVVRIQANLPVEIQAIVEKLCGPETSIDAAKQALRAASQSPRWERWLLLSLAASVLAEHHEYAAALDVVAIDELASYVPYFSSMLPIAWHEMQIPESAVDVVSQHLTSKSETARLVAASWLLTNEQQRRDSIKVLNALMSDRTQSLNSQLARAVLWRTTPLGEAAEQRNDSLRTIFQLPIASQAGPLLIIGEDEAKMDLREDALEHFFAIHLLYEFPKSVVKIAGDRSKQLLAQLGRTE